MSEANNLQAPWTALPEINRFPREKKTTTKKQQPIRSEWGGGRRSGLLNINQQVSGERGESCGDAVSGPISISCSPARLQPRLRSDFYSTRQATSGTVTLFRSIIPAVLYTNHDMMHLWLSHPWRAGGGASQLGWDIRLYRLRNDLALQKSRAVNKSRWGPSGTS